MEMTIPVERRGGRPRAQDETNRMGGDHDRKAWQAIKTAYGRAPFFEEMEDELRGLFEDGPGTLGAWNRASIVWASSWLDIPVPTDVSAAEYPDTESVDLPSLVASFAAGRSCNWSHVWQDRQRSIPFESLVQRQAPGLCRFHRVDFRVQDHIQNDNAGLFYEVVNAVVVGQHTPHVTKFCIEPGLSRAIWCGVAAQGADHR